MNKLVAKLERFAKRELSNPIVSKTIHTAWQAALGAVVANLSGTHGDVKAVVLVGVAAAAAAVKNLVVQSATAKPSVPSQPIVDPHNTAS